MSNNNIFRIFNPRGPKEDPKERRRGQLRRAQQAHRDRKDQYARSLEQELGRTRASEVKLVRQVENLRATVQMLCSRFGIDPPVELQIEQSSQSPSNSLQDGAYSASASPFSSSNDGRSKAKMQPNIAASRPNFEVGNKASYDPLTPSWTSPESVNEYRPSVEPWSLSPQGNYQDQASKFRGYSTGVSKPREISRDSSIRLSELDQVTVGMEFVLSLEEPCLGHVHGDPSKPQEPTGHALTTTAHLFSVCSHSKSPKQRSASPETPSYLDTPKATLERLLSLSPNVVTDGQVTPIQAWNHIRSRPFFGALDIPSLRNLAGKLRDAVKCHGFGAVVQQPIFERLVLETLMLGRDF